MTDEPYGHRGHPTHGEESRASYTRQRLGATVTVLQQEGFSHREALAFVAGLAVEIAAARGETWHNTQSAMLTLDRLLTGGAAKHWSLDAIERALSTVAELTQEGAH